MYIGCKLRNMNLPCQLFSVQQYSTYELGKDVVDEIYQRVKRSIERVQTKVLILADLPTVGEYSGLFAYERKTAQLIKMAMRRYMQTIGRSYTMYLYIALCLIHQLDDVKVLINSYDMFVTEASEDSNIPSIAIIFCVYKLMDTRGLLYLLEDGAIRSDLSYNYDLNRVHEFADEFIKLNLV